MANRCEKMDAVADFTFLGSKITADSDCSHEIKRHLLIGRKAMTNLDSVLKSRDTKGNKNRPKKKKRERERHHFADKDPCS